MLFISTMTTYVAVDGALCAEAASNMTTIIEQALQLIDVADSLTQYVELGQSAATAAAAGHVTAGALSQLVEGGVQSM